MSDFRESNHVAQSNELIVSRWGLSNTLLKLFEMAVSCIDTSKPIPSRKVTLNKQDIFNLFEYNSTDRYVVFQRHIQQLQGQKVILQDGDKKRSVVLVTTVEWGEGDDDNEVSFYFNEHIMTHLIELHDHFTQYEILELKGMKGQYSIPLFKFLVMEHNKKINKSEHAKNGYVKTEISLENLRYITATENKYKDFRNFKRRVLDSSINEINAIRDNGTGKTNILVKYETVHGKYNRTIAINFFVRRKQTAFDNDFDNPRENPYKTLDVNAPRSIDTNKISADQFHKQYYEQKVKLESEQVDKDQMSIDDVLKE